MTTAINDPRTLSETGALPVPERLTAMEAVVRLLVDQAALDARAGHRTGGFATGYPGSPVGGLQAQLEAAGQALREVGVHQSPGLNEELAATAVWGTQTVTQLPGASVEGVFALWYGKAPGVDRAADALRHGNIRGTHPLGGVLVVAGDDPNANATVFPSDSLGIFEAMAMPVLYPGSVQEILDLGHHGYALSRAAGLWVGMKLVTTVADGSGTVDTSLDRLDFRVPEVLVDGAVFRPTLRVTPGPTMREAERDLYAGRLRLAAAYIAENRLNPVVVDPPGARIGLLAPGKSYYDLRSALESLGLDDGRLAELGIRVKQVRAPFPVAPEEWQAFAEGLDEIVVVEEKRPVLERALKEALYGRDSAPHVSGKLTPAGLELFPHHGEFGPDLVARRLGAHLTERGVPITAPGRIEPRVLLPILPLATSRKPFFCSGCPHNTSLKAPEGAVVGAGIGCHIMSLLVDREEYGDQTGYTQMGGEGAQWVGQSPFTTLAHTFQNVGDGTFHHSASLALRMAVASGVNLTYKVLYNSAVGMTGGQDVRGAMEVPALTHSLEAEGVRRIIITSDDPRRHRRRDLAKVVTDVWHRDRIIEAQEVLAATPGVTVLIHDQQCAADRRRRWRSGEQTKTTKRVVINERVCEGCGDCNAKSQCLSVQPTETPFGRKTRINQSSCNLDFSCVNGDCPSFMTVDTARVDKGSAAARPAASTPPTGLPLPTPVVSRDGFSAHSIGIGGTGVVSINAVLAAAAARDGLQVRSLDLPGSSIKAGPVVSQMQVFESGEIDPAATIAPGAADLFLGFDLLGAMTEPNLAPLSSDRTVVVANIALEPTGDMAVDSAVPLPRSQELLEVLEARTRVSANVYIDVDDVCDRVFGNQTNANALLVGAAFQAGAIPFSVEAMHDGFRDVGVAVERNLAAFEWGRAAVADPAGLPASRGSGASHGAGTVPPALAKRLGHVMTVPGLRELVALRYAELVAYQDESYAETYLASVLNVFARERAALGGDAADVTSAYAHGLHKLMAYKDEYEVARLLLLDSARAQVEAEFGRGATPTWHLHPPMLRALGMRRKLRLGPWARPALVGLRAGRRVRGTRLDVFGAARVRRVERLLVDHYRAVVDRSLGVLTAETQAAVLGLVAAADGVRGYEHVKLRNVVGFLDTVARRGADLGLDTAASAELTGLATAD